MECYTSVVVNKYTRKNFLQNWLLGLVALGLNIALAYITISILIRLFSFPIKPSSPINTLVMAVIVVIAFLLLVAEMYWITEADKWFQGNQGELEVGHQLRKLAPQYIVLENIVLGPARWNIDFVVIGPKGVAVVEVKSHSGFVTFRDGKLLKNGWPFEKNFLWPVEAQTKELEKTIRTGLGKFIQVNPFLVFSSRFARLKFGKHPLPGTRIVVVGKKWINNCIHGQNGTYLSDSEVKRIEDFLKQYQQE